MSFFLLLNTKEDILKNVENQTGAIDFHRMEKNTVEAIRTIKIPTFFKIYYFVFNKKETQRIHVLYEFNCQ